jgi:hypothetical protein
MKVDYDSEGKSLLFEFAEFRVAEDDDYVELLADDNCIVWIHDGLPDSMQVLGADKDITPLGEAAERFQLDADCLRVAAQAALDLPDREITFEVGPQRVVGSEAQAA